MFFKIILKLGSIQRILCCAAAVPISCELSSSLTMLLYTIWIFWDSQKRSKLYNFGAKWPILSLGLISITVTHISTLRCSLKCCNRFVVHGNYVYMSMAVVFLGWLKNLNLIRQIITIALYFMRFEILRKKYCKDLVFTEYYSYIHLIGFSCIVQIVPKNIQTSSFRIRDKFEGHREIIM